MEVLTSILQSNLLVGIILLLVIIPIWFKIGLLDKLWGKKNGNGKEGLKELTENHLPHLEQKIDKLLEMQQEITYILKDFKEDGIKIKGS